MTILSACGQYGDLYAPPPESVEQVQPTENQVQDQAQTTDELQQSEEDSAK